VSVTGHNLHFVEAMELCLYAWGSGESDGGSGLGSDNWRVEGQSNGNAASGCLSGSGGRYSVYLLY
jgi:hypothetical protein